MIPSNYHTHTTRCLHAVGSEKQYIESAISAGMKELGFSDHCPVPFKTDYVSNIRMTMQEAPEYVDCIRSLQKEYEKDIQIFCGFEMEYMPKYFDEQISFFDSLGIDYLIMGEHFCDDEDGGHYTGEPTTDPAHLTQYVDTVIEGLKTKRFKYLCHPDLINFTGSSDLYTQEMTRLCLALKEMNIPVEVNGLGHATNRHYPSPRFFNIAAKVGCDAVVGMDAHDPDTLKNQLIYDSCVGIIKELGMNQVFVNLYND